MGFRIELATIINETLDELQLDGIEMPEFEGSRARVQRQVLTLLVKRLCEMLLDRDKALEEVETKVEELKARESKLRSEVNRLKKNMVGGNT